MHAHAGRGHLRRFGDEALAALGTRDESEGVSHVVPVGACARRILLAQGVQSEAVGAGRGLDVAAVAGVLADNLEGFEHGEGGAVVLVGERGINVGEGGRRHVAYDTAPHTPKVTSSMACDRSPYRSYTPAVWPQAQPHHPAVQRPPPPLSVFYTQYIL